jgi:hypothetical protein
MVGSQNPGAGNVIGFLFSRKAAGMMLRVSVTRITEDCAPVMWFTDQLMSGHGNPQSHDN